MSLTDNERKALDDLVEAVEHLMLDMSPESVGRIADYVGENGTDGEGGVAEDGVVLESLRLIVDQMARARTR